MSDFADIPAPGDSLTNEADEEAEVVSGDETEEGENTRDGKYRFNGKYMYVTWSKSKIDSKEEFHEKLLARLPAGARVFGGRELHQDGTPHYHVVISLAEKKHWRDTANVFRLEGDTTAVRIDKPRPGQRTSDFLETTMSYCSKDGDTFGERLSLEGVVAEQKKRKWQDIIDADDEEESWKMIRETDPRAYMVNYPALEKAMQRKKRVVLTVAEKERPSGKFRVPKIMELWMKRYVVERKWKGRPKSLVIIGDPMVGKSAYAESQGNPIVMNSGWCMNSIFPGATHIVVSDVKPAAFGYGGKSHWRDVLGGQPEFLGRDFQKETRVIPWGIPCVWTCNFDNDPRKDKGVAEYMEWASVVVEVRDRVGERCWGKLYEAEAAHEDDEDIEWKEALLQSNSFLDSGCVDEALDVSNDFGI
jgi:hypothetical protein